MSAYSVGQVLGVLLLLAIVVGLVREAIKKRGDPKD